MAEEELIEKYRKLASLVEELSKKYGEVGIGEEFAKKLKEIEERVDFKLRQIDEKIAGIKEVPLPKKLKEELITSSRQQAEEALKEIKELPELKRLGIFESLVEKLTEKVGSFDERVERLEREVRRPVEELVPELSEMRDFLASSDRIISSKVKGEVEKRLKDILVGLSEVRKDLRNLTRVNEGLKKEIGSIEERISRFRKETGEIVGKAVKEEFVEKLERNVSKELPGILESKVAEVEDRVDTMVKERASEIAKKIGEVSASLRTLGIEIEKLKLSQDELRNNLPKIRDEVFEKLRADMAEEIKNKVEGGLNAYSSKAKEEYEKMSAQILKLRNSIEKITEAFSKNLKERDRLLKDRIIGSVNRLLPKKIAGLERRVIKKVDEKIFAFEETRGRFVNELEKIGKDLENKIEKVNASFTILKGEVEERLKKMKIEKIVASTVEKHLDALKGRVEEFVEEQKKISKRIADLETVASKLPELVEEVEK